MNKIELFVDYVRFDRDKNFDFIKTINQPNLCYQIKLNNEVVRTVGDIDYGYYLTILIYDYFVPFDIISYFNDNNSRYTVCNSCLSKVFYNQNNILEFSNNNVDKRTKKDIVRENDFFIYSKVQSNVLYIKRINGETINDFDLMQSLFLEYCKSVGEVLEIDEIELSIDFKKVRIKYHKNKIKTFIKKQKNKNT